MTLFIIDIDGTIAHAGRRFKEAGPEPSRDDKANYEAWVQNVQNRESLLADQPVTGMVDLADALSLFNGGVTFYLTSREAKWRDVTREWLQLHKFFPSPLIMRSDGDYAEGADFKERAICVLQQQHDMADVVVIDDDEKGTIETMCKRRGWTFLKARSGGQR